MPVNLRQAAEETAAFLAAHKNFSGDREVVCVTPFHAELPSISLDTLRALYALASDLVELSAQHDPETVRALLR